VLNGLKTATNVVHTSNNDND